jgi:formylglycine-generating enzyme required for sulfatase activity
MQFIRGGNMFMGEKGLLNAEPPHRVTVSSFCLDKVEVTTAAYDACARSGNCLKSTQDVKFPGMTERQREKFKQLCNTRVADKQNHPINCVDWAMADNFCRSAGGRLPAGGARLPTEAEWEFAARGSSQRTYPWGDEPPDATRLNACGTECERWMARHLETIGTMYKADDGWPGTAPVGTFPKGASSDGILDLAGNVWEWTADWYGAYSAEAQTDAKGPSSGNERVVRGGSYNGTESDWAKPSYRWKTAPDTFNHSIGMRCAKAPE